jgi:5-hydroxyisourate hydrolase
MSPITTHILDTARGQPAEGIAVALEFGEGKSGWREIARGQTNRDGRLTTLLPDGVPLSVGMYRLRFATGEYHSSMGTPGFFPEVQVVFQVADPDAHYHIPLLLSPFGYSTYRGS